MKDDDLVRRKDVELALLEKGQRSRRYKLGETWELDFTEIREALADVPSAHSDENKYEYHYDHTDCIWYRPEARNRCPATCAQYRDGWNDAMNYIFKDGAGYRPFRRDKKYEG